jgi:hypothetical protein
MDEIDKAELIQALKAYFIPVAMFIACVMSAAGVFLIREGYGLGWLVIGAAVTLLAAAFIACATFQNKLRAQGLMKDKYDTPAPGFEEEFSADKQAQNDAQQATQNAEMQSTQTQTENRAKLGV